MENVIEETVVNRRGGPRVRITSKGRGSEAYTKVRELQEEEDGVVYLRRGKNFCVGEETLGGTGRPSVPDTT